MDQLRQLFQKLSWTQRILLAAAAAAVIGGLVMLSHWNQERDFKPLFTGLAAEDAGAIVAKLHESATEYRLADNGATVLVPSASVAELRLQMASAGLPKSGRIGFELFDKTNFGVSEFAEQVNYRRAIEGELERSVMSIREVEDARLHISPAKDSLYTESRQPAKASVLVKLRRGAELSPQNVAAICQLVASAVEGLLPDQVSVVDANGNLLNRVRNNSADAADGSEAALDYRKLIEHDLQKKIAATLEPLLGADHFETSVSAEVDLTSGEQSEEVFDPQKSVMLTSQRTDDGPALPTASGVPGTTSNVPVPPAKPVTASGNFARHTESLTYQTSRVVKLTKLPRGTVKRLSLSVLVDHTARSEGTGDKAKRVINAPSAEELKVIRDLVSAATGLNTERGDQLVVEAFPFEATLAEPPFQSPPSAPAAPAAGVQIPPWLDKLIKKSPKVAAGAAAGAVIVLILGAWFLLRRSRKKNIQAQMAAAALEAARQKSLPLSPEEMQKQMEGHLAQNAADKARQELETLLQLRLPAVSTKKTEVLAKHISLETKSNPGPMAQVVRTWLNG